MRRRHEGGDSQFADQLWTEYAHTHDPRTRETIIHLFERLAYGIANRFSRRGVADEDLAQVAMLGLVEAVDRFDPTTHYCFSTFAIPTILGAIRHHFRDHYWSVHVPRGVQELAQHLKRMELVMFAELGRSPTFGELSVRLQVSEESLVEAAGLEEFNHLVSLDGRFQTADPAAAGPLTEVLGGEDPDLLGVELSIALDQALGHLPPTLREVLRLRYLGELSQRAVGRRLGLSQMQVSRLEKQALSELRRELAPAGLMDEQDAWSGVQSILVDR